jgi:hypothetical protein
MIDNGTTCPWCRTRIYLWHLFMLLRVHHAVLSLISSSMAELGNNSKCSVSKNDMKELYQNVPEELKNEGLFEGKRNGELKNFRKKRNCNRRMNKGPQMKLRGVNRCICRPQ